jgi:hypothetical protein
MGYTFRIFLAGGVDAVESEFGDGRTPALCRPFKLGNGRYCYPLTVTDHASWRRAISTSGDIICDLPSSPEGAI